MGNLRPFRSFLVVATLLVLASLVLEHVNGRFWLSDFRVYYMAADNLRHGLPVYDQVFGVDTGLYKYAPVVLYFFLPYTFLSFHVAGIIHFLLIGLFTMACFVVIERSLSQLFAPLPAVAGRALLGLLCIAVLLARELHMGNINMGLILLSVWGIERWLTGRTRTAGVLWGLVWLIKPYLLLMLVPLVMRREWRILRTATATMAIGFLAPLVFQRPVSGWELDLHWIRSMQYHTEVMFSPDHFGQLWATHLGTPLSTTMTLLFIALAGLSLAVFTWSNVKRGRQGSMGRLDRAFELWLAIAVVPNLVITDQQHFMFSLPLILFILAYFFTHRDRWGVWAFVLVMLLYGTRSSDLWSGPLENQLVAWGALGIGNLLLIGLACSIRHKWNKAPAS